MPTKWNPGRGLSWATLVVTALAASPAVAGRTFVSDDPEPTDLGRFEIYTIVNRTNTRADERRRHR